MAKRKSEAATILRFFQTAPVDTAQVVFELVRETLKARKGPVQVATRRTKGVKANSQEAATDAPAASA